MSGKTFVSELYRAMKDGVDERVHALIAEHRHELDAPVSQGDGCVPQVLIAAVWSGRPDYLQALVDAGADVNARDPSREGSSHNLRPLEAALWFHNAPMERVLLEAGATEDFGTWVFRLSLIHI